VEKTGFLFIWVGTSKSARKDIAHRVALQFNLPKVVKYTSRSPRIGEIQGIDQHYLSSEKFAAMADQGAFVDVVSNDRGERFGVALKDVQAAIGAGRSAYITSPDALPNLTTALGDAAVTVFTLTDKARLRDRLLELGETEGQIVERMKHYDAKIAKSAQYRHVLRNDSTFEAVDEAVSIVRGYLG